MSVCRCCFVVNNSNCLLSITAVVVIGCGVVAVVVSMTGVVVVVDDVVVTNSNCLLFV